MPLFFTCYATLLTVWAVSFFHVAMNLSLNFGSENPYGVAIYLSYCFIIIGASSIGFKIDEYIDKKRRK